MRRSNNKEQGNVFVFMSFRCTLLLNYCLMFALLYNVLIHKITKQIFKYHVSLHVYFNVFFSHFLLKLQFLCFTFKF